MVCYAWSLMGALRPWHTSACFLLRSSPGGGKTGVFIIVRSVSAGGYSRSQEAAGVTPWGFPNQFENE